MPETTSETALVIEAEAITELDETMRSLRSILMRLARDIAISEGRSRVTSEDVCRARKEYRDALGVRSDA